MLQCVWCLGACGELVVLCGHCCVCSLAYDGGGGGGCFRPRHTALDLDLALDGP